MKRSFQLSITSRILVAFASGALIAVYFLPAWRIDLFAPQYPEGLTMYIWINKLSGDVDIINGLNHYIGMKHISAAMFPEFRYLPIVVGLFMMMGMLAAITGNSRLLFVYVVLTIIGGMLVPYDLYRWGYKYGHELDPTAPIQVPGLTYQPPVIGHKRLLNFDAYSFPDVAGWIVIGAGALACLVLVLELYHHRKQSIKPVKKGAAIPAAMALLFIMLLGSCAAKPHPLVAGRDECYVCKMGVADLAFGGELVTSKGKTYKFDDMGCLMNFLKSQTVPEEEFELRLVMNHEKPGEFLDAQQSYYLQSPHLRSPMKSNLSAYESRETAMKVKGDRQGEIYTWDELYSHWK